MGKKRWAFLFLRRNLKTNFGKDLICFFASALGNMSLLLSVGYFSSYPSAIESQSHYALDYGVYKVSEKKRVSAGDSPLQLVETRRPPLESCLDMAENSSIQWGYDFSYFFPEAAEFELSEGEKESIRLVPVYSFLSWPSWRPSLISGALPNEDSIGYCVINESLAKKMKEMDIGEKLEFSTKVEAKIEGEAREETRSFVLSVSGVVRDFPFLSAPKIYYSYLGLEDFYANCFFGEGDETVFRLVKEAEPNSSLSGFSRLAFSFSHGDVSLLSNAAKATSNGLSFSSEIQQSIESFRMLNQSFSSSLGLFSALSLIGVSLVLGMSNYSNFVFRRKENAELLAMGAVKFDIFCIYFIEILTLCLSSSFLCFCLSPLMNSLTDLFFKSKFGVGGLARIPLLRFGGFPFGLELIFLGLSLFIGFVSSLPLLRAKNGKLLEELRDE